MNYFSSSPKYLFISFWHNRSLIYTLTWRQVEGRYRGSYFGLLWPFLNPLLMLLVYTFVFSVAFKTHWPGGGGSTSEFALLLFIGLIFFNFFAECITTSPAQILNNVNYVKKVIFPLEILSWVSILTAAFHFLISLGVWFIAYIIFFGLPQVATLLLPLVFIPFGFFTLGLCWFLSALGVYMRDILQIVGVALSALMFLSPIFYSVKSLPDQFQKFILFNPLSIPIEQARELLFWGGQPQFQLLSEYWLFSLAICWLGFSFFQNVRKGFADVI